LENVLDLLAGKVYATTTLLVCLAQCYYPYIIRPNLFLVGVWDIDVQIQSLIKLIKFVIIHEVLWTSDCLSQTSVYDVKYFVNDNYNTVFLDFGNTDRPTSQLYNAEPTKLWPAIRDEAWLHILQDDTMNVACTIG
jgi:hypothetical protein